jgi:hypothetical protein
MPLPGGARGPGPWLRVPGRRFRCRRGGRRTGAGQGAGAAPGGELAQVQRVGLAGQAAVSGQESGEGEPFGVGEGGLDRDEGVDGAAVVIGHLPAGLRPGGLGQPQVPAIERKPNVSALATQTTSQSPGKLPTSATRDTRQTAPDGWGVRSGSCWSLSVRSAGKPGPLERRHRRPATWQDWRPRRLSTFPQPRSSTAGQALTSEFT